MRCSTLISARCTYYRQYRHHRYQVRPNKPLAGMWALQSGLKLAQELVRQMVLLMVKM
jgi:hypothetical protein